MESAKSGLLNFIVVSVLLALLATSYVSYVMPVLEEAEAVKKETLLGNFQRVVVQARAQWIKTKSAEVSIYETQLSTAGRLTQSKHAKASVAMNKNGWPTGAALNTANACEYLLFLSSQDESQKMSIDQRMAKGFLVCEYYKDDVLWFVYTAENGAIRTHV